MDENDFFQTSVGLHFLDCLSFSKRQLSLANSDIREWPWTILGLTALVQSVCALYLDERDTMEVATLATWNSNMGKTIKALQHDSTTQVPKPKMASPEALLDRVLEQERQMNFASDNKIDLSKLFVLRNEFTHFTPKNWVVEISGLPQIAKSVFLLVEQILQKPGLYSRLSGSKRDIALAHCVECMNFITTRFEKL